TRANDRYFGFEKGVYNDGIRIQGGVTGTSTISSLDNGKLYDLRFYHTWGAGNNNDKSELSVKIGSTVKSQYSELNNWHYIEFTGISPSSGNIVFNAYPSGTGSPVRNSQLCVVELFERA